MCSGSLWHLQATTTSVALLNGPSNSRLGAEQRRSPERGLQVSGRDEAAGHDFQTVDRWLLPINCTRHSKMPPASAGNRFISTTTRLHFKNGFR